MNRIVVIDSLATDTSIEYSEAPLVCATLLVFIGCFALSRAAEPNPVEAA
jgi:hypothetical protein